MKKSVKKNLIKLVAIVCSAMLLFLSPCARYIDASSIQTVYASDWAIVGGSVAVDVILKALIGALGGYAAKEAYEAYKDEINQSFYDYISAPGRFADLIGEKAKDTCVKIYNKASNTIQEISWEEMMESLSQSHDVVVDDLTDLYAQYCPALLESFGDFITDVVNGDVYISGVSEMFMYDAFSDYESIQNSDGSYHFSGYEYFDKSVNGNIYYNVFDCDSMYKLVGVYGVSLNTISIYRPDIYYGRTSLKATTVYGMQYVNGELRGSISRNYLGEWASADGTPSLKCLNIPLYSSSNDAITAIDSGDFSSALNYSDITMESVIDLTHVPDLAPDIPPFTRSWQQKEWERIANSPDVIGIGSYGHGIYDDNWGDDIPWIGLESLQDYSRSLLDIYNQIIDDIINGTYDSSEDIPGTYSEAWEKAISEAWDNVEQSTDTVPGESEKDKPTDGDDEEKEDPEGGGGGSGDSNNDQEEPPEGGDGNTQSPNLSKNNFKHSLNRHMPSKFVQQLGHQSRQAIEALLIKRTFFNIDWTEDQVIEALTLAYEEALNNGLTSGEYSFMYLGETIIIYLENGLFKTGYGLHSYTYDELYELFLLLGGE